MNYRPKLSLQCHTEIVERRREQSGESCVGQVEVKLHQTATKMRKDPLNTSFLETSRENMQRGTEK